MNSASQPEPGKTPAKTTMGGRIRSAIAAIGRTGTRWLRATDSGLERAEQAVLVALLDRVDHETWCVPRRWHHGQGVSVERLGELCGYRRRRTFWAIRRLEARGLIRVDRRPPLCSQYEIMADKILQLAELHRSRLEQWLVDQAEVRAERWSQVVDVALSVLPVSLRAALEGSSPAAAGQEAPAPKQAKDRAALAADRSLPGWAQSVARSKGLGDTAEVARFVYTTTAAVCREVLGDEMHPDRFGGEAARVVALWEAQGRPEPADLVEDLRRVVSAVREAPGLPWATYRGERQRRNDRIPKDRRHDLHWFLRPSNFLRLLGEARRVAAEASPCDTTSPSDAASSPLSSTAEIAPLSFILALPEEAPAEPVSAETFAARWAALRSSLKAEMGVLYDVWIAPLQVELSADCVQVDVPNRVFLQWIRDRYAQRFPVAFGASVRFSVRGPPDS